VIPLVSPVVVDVRNVNPAYWAAKRAAVLAAVYPGGFPTALVDLVEDFAMGAGGTPDESSEVMRYTVASPGGRSGGSPSYAYLFVPKVDMCGKCHVFLGGHAPNGIEEYLHTEEYRMIDALLALGWLVVGIDMPNFGPWQPAQVVVANGTTYAQTKNVQHFPTGAPTSTPTGEPSYTRLYTDHVILAVNQIVEDYGISRFSLSGHSGGGQWASMVAALDSRYRDVQILQGMDYTVAQAGNPVEWETWTEKEDAVAAQHIAHGGQKDLIAVGASFPGRSTVCHTGPSEDAGLTTEANLTEWAARVNVWLKTSTGSELEYRRKQSAGHAIAADQGIVEHLELHV
jgi:predicted alpha/beta-hydrolase family hydrolase